jgi:hypothetical protein
VPSEQEHEDHLVPDQNADQGKDADDYHEACAATLGRSAAAMPMGAARRQTDG